VHYVFHRVVVVNEPAMTVHAIFTGLCVVCQARYDRTHGTCTNTTVREGRLDICGGEIRECPECDGQGEVLEAPDRVLDGRAYMTPCPVCRGGQ